MRLEDFWAALRRRWYLVIVALLLSVVAAAGAVYLIGPTYKALGAILILPPGTATKADGGSDGNPYLSLGGVSQARDVVIRSVMSSTMHEELCTADGDSAYNTMRASMCGDNPSVTYLATPDFTSSAPMILVTTEADTPANSIAALRAVADRVPTTLRDLQKNLNLRDRALITSMPVVMDSIPEVVHKKQIRGGIVAGAGTLAIGLLLIGLIDGLVLGRRASLVEADDAGGDVADEPSSDSGDGERPEVVMSDDGQTEKTEHSEAAVDDAVSEAEGVRASAEEGSETAMLDDGETEAEHSEAVAGAPSEAQEVDAAADLAPNHTPDGAINGETDEETPIDDVAASTSPSR